jgi:2-phosphosulfolactate phosphatase
MSVNKPIKIDVILAPDLLTEAEMGNTLCAVIDVLRATSTITAAFANGILKVVPFKNATEVRAYAASLSMESYLLGGEEKSLRIPGFDLGNSPLEYTDTVVKGKTLLFSTSNGTPTMQRAYAGSRAPVYIASLLNISAVSGAMAKRGETEQFGSLTFVCSGRRGKPSSEDTFCAGLGVQKLSQMLVDKGISPELTDCAFIAAHFAWSNNQKVLAVLAGCEHGRSLLPLGFEKDIELAAQVDRYRIAPVFDGKSITLSQQE